MSASRVGSGDPCSTAARPPMSTYCTPWRSRQAKSSSARSAATSLVADQRTLRADRQIKTQKRRVGVEPLLGRPAEPLDDQAAVAIVASSLTSKRLGERVRLRFGVCVSCHAGAFDPSIAILSSAAVATARTGLALVSSRPPAKTKGQEKGKATLWTERRDRKHQILLGKKLAPREGNAYHVFCALDGRNTLTTASTTRVKVSGLRLPTVDVGKSDED